MLLPFLLWINYYFKGTSSSGSSSMRSMIGPLHFRMSTTMGVGRSKLEMTYRSNFYYMIDELLYHTHQ